MKKKVLLLVTIVAVSIFGGVVSGVIDMFFDSPEHGRELPTERTLSSQEIMVVSESVNYSVQGKLF